jgi:hypothetical protein
MISHVEHEIISPVVEAACQELLASRQQAFVAVPDMSGRMDPAMMRAAIASMQPLIVGTGSAMPMLSNQHTGHGVKQWTTKQNTSKTTYSLKGRKAKQRRNRK